MVDTPSLAESRRLVNTIRSPRAMEGLGCDAHGRVKCRSGVTLSWGKQGGFRDHVEGKEDLRNQWRKM